VGAEARGGGDPRPAARRLRALGPGLAVHVCAGTVPGVAATSLIRALLVKGPVLVKPGAGDVVLPVLLARALAGAGEVGGVLAGALAVLYWPGGTRSLEEPALAAADLAVIYGDDDTVGALRPLLRPSTRLVAYPHRVSLAVVGSAALAPGPAPGVASRLARAVASFDQRGCVSPRQVFLLGADGPAATRFGAELDASLRREAEELPSGPLEPAEAAAVQQLRATVELRAAAGERLELLRGPDLAWTVVVDPAPSLEASCLARTLHVTPVPDVDALERALEPGGAHLQSVGIAGLAGAESEVVERLARLGATRCVPLDQVAFPPAWWMHDGQGPLRSLVRWVEWVPAAP
jgi:hypothetical protein